MFGAAPESPFSEAAAIPATNVPWPRPSPAELFGSELRLMEAITREPKSSERESIPLSTTAIAGCLSSVCNDSSLVQLPEAPATYGQSWKFENIGLILPLTCVGASGVIESRPSLPCE